MRTNLISIVLALLAALPGCLVPTASHQASADSVPVGVAPTANAGADAPAAVATLDEGRSGTTTHDGNTGQYACVGNLVVARCQVTIEPHVRFAGTGTGAVSATLTWIAKVPAAREMRVSLYTADRCSSGTCWDPITSVRGTSPLSLESTVNGPFVIEILSGTGAGYCIIGGVFVTPVDQTFQLASTSLRAA